MIRVRGAGFASAARRKLHDRTSGYRSWLWTNAFRARRPGSLKCASSSHSRFAENTTFKSGVAEDEFPVVGATWFTDQTLRCVPPNDTIV